MDPATLIPKTLRDTEELPRYTPRGDRILVDLCDQFTAEFVILDNLKGRVGFISSDVAEQIKRTHAPLSKKQSKQDIWIRHVPKHCHCHDDDTPDLSARKWSSKPSKLGMETRLEESRRHARQYEQEKERQAVAAQEGASP